MSADTVDSEEIDAPLGKEHATVLSNGDASLIIFEGVGLTIAAEIDEQVRESTVDRELDEFTGLIAGVQSGRISDGDRE